MFDSLSDRFESVFQKITGRGRLSEADIDEVMREIRVALLEADVAVQVARAFVQRVKARLVGVDLSPVYGDPAKQVIAAVRDELIDVLGGEGLTINFASKPPTVILMAGLQGSGKTTSTGKLALWFKQQGRNPLLVGADLQRPAAVEQLRVLGSQVGVPVFSEASDPVSVARHGLEEARRLGKDVLIVDTAGRLVIDDELMTEVAQISDAVEPHYTFLVVDAMIGQAAVETAEAFHQTLAIDGVILTKLDGDARGGAALSVKEVVGRPIAFAATGEKLDEFGPFYADRMASRILGMGDVLTLIEEAEKAFDQEQAEAAASKLVEGDFTLADFLEQMQAVRKMGPLKNLLGLMPGMGKQLKDVDLPEKELDRVEAIIRSMTKAERSEPDIVDASRRQRIAAGSGTTVQEVNNLLKQFGEMRKMMKGSMGQLMKAGMGGGMGGRLKQARAIQKGVKDGTIDPAQLQALGLPGGVPGLDAPGTAKGGRPALPGLPGAGGPRPPGKPGGRTTAPGTQSGPQQKKKKKKR
jgi:signal recognition particle subunit SRP54